MSVPSAEESPPTSHPEGGSEPTVEAETQAEQRRAARWGVAALGARAVLQHLLVLVANVYLARTLKPADYGVFAILQFALALFKLLGDAGLGAALIQQKEAPTRRELSSIWWFQLGLTSSIVLLTFLLGPFVLELWPNMPDESSWLLRGLSLGLLFTMLRAVPMLLLERSLRFGWLAGLEFFGSIAFYSSAVVLAARGYGAGALVTATVLQAGAIAVAANLVNPWLPALELDRKRLVQLVRFGLSFQGTHVVGFTNQAVTPLVAGIRLGKEALGYVNFAQSVAWLPTLPVGIISRVSFPLLSRLQHDKQAFAEELEHAIVMCGLLTFFFVGLCVGAAPAIVQVIFSDRWIPAIPAVYVYAMAIAVGFFYTIGGAALDALGRPGLLFKLTIMVTLVNWPSVLIATTLHAVPEAFATGYAMHVLVGNVAIVIVLKRLVPGLRIFSRLRGLLLGGVVVALAGRLVLPFTFSIVGLVLYIVGALLLYVGASLGVDSRLRSAVILFINRRRRKSAEAT